MDNTWFHGSMNALAGSMWWTDVFLCMYSIISFVLIIYFYLHADGRNMVLWIHLRPNVTVYLFDWNALITITYSLRGEVQYGKVLFIYSRYKGAYMAIWHRMHDGRAVCKILCTCTWPFFMEVCWCMNVKWAVGLKYAVRSYRTEHATRKYFIYISCRWPFI